MKKTLPVLILSSSIIIFSQHYGSFAAHDDQGRSRGGAWSNEGVYTGTPGEEEEIRRKFFKEKPIEIPPYKDNEDEKEESEETGSNSGEDQTLSDDTEE